MDTEKVCEFITFSKIMNFRSAAAELHMSQPTLSQHVRDLEAEVGCELVRRGSIGVPNELTPAGVHFVGLGEEFLACRERMVDECRRIADELSPARIQDLNSGFGISVQIRKALEAHGYRCVNIAYAKVDLPVLDALDHGLLDFGVTVGFEPGVPDELRAAAAGTYGSVPLAPEPLGILVGSRNPLAQQDAVTLAQLEDREVFCASSPSYTSWFETVPGLFSAQGCRILLRPMPDTARDGGAFPLLDRRISVTTRHYAKYYRGLEVEDVRFLPIADARVEIQPYLVYRRDNCSPMVRRIVECMGAMGEPGDSRGSGSEGV